MPQKRTNIFDSLLMIVALGILTSLFLKAVFDMDTNYDVGWYHLPFAARIWRIIPEQSFTSGDKVEFRYDGFPLLAHFFQGFLWKITGRIQSTNLVGFFSVIIYLFFLRSYSRIPFKVSTIAVFTIPAVITHAPTGFVDLPANIGASIFLMMIYCFFKQSQFPDKKGLLYAILGAALAANTKPQLQPIIFILFLVFVGRVIYLYFKHTKASFLKIYTSITLSTLASIVIFAFPIKNIIYYGNPFYPIKIEIAGYVLNHEMTPETYREGRRPQKWLRSILEINTPEWSADQSNRTYQPNYLDRAGGFFGVYVIFNLLLLLGQAIKEKIDNKQSQENQKHEATTALLTIILISPIVANFPQSHELRYLMFWMIGLVSLNLDIIYSKSEYIQNKLNLNYFKFSYLLFFIIMCIKIKHFYLKPDFRNLKTYLDSVTNTEYLGLIIPGAKNCAVARHGLDSTDSIPIEHIFYYNSYFHQDIKPKYSIKVVDNINKCGNLNTIPVARSK